MLGPSTIETNPVLLGLHDIDMRPGFFAGEYGARARYRPSPWLWRQPAAPQQGPARRRFRVECSDMRLTDVNM